MIDQNNTTLNNNNTCFINQVYPYTVRAIEETVKIAAVSVFLFIAGQVIILSNSPNRVKITKAFWSNITLKPVAEEIIFRLLSHRLIYLAQCGYNKLLQRTELTEEQKKGQMIFRVILSAALFSLTHLVINKGRKLHIQGPITFIGGLAYGGLFEKYHTLSIGILFHGINNLLAAASTINPIPLFPIALLLNRCAAFYLLFRK